MTSGDRADVAAMKMITFARCLARIEQYTSPGPILDIGTATGFFLEVAQRRGFDAYGVEVSGFAASIAATKLPIGRVLHGTLEDVRLPSGFFNALTMFDLLEHVADPLCAFRKAHDLLKPAGVLMIVTPDTTSLSRRLLGNFWPHYKAEHVTYWSPRAIRVAAKKSGYCVEFVEPTMKALTLRYIEAQCTKYSHPLLSATARALRCCSRVSDVPFIVPTGELIACLRRVGSLK